LQPLTFQRGQTTKLHFEDGISLCLRQIKALSELDTGGFGIRRTADGLDNHVQIVDGLQQTFEDVGTLTTLAEFEFRTTDDHFIAVFEINLKTALEVQCARFALYQCQNLDAEAGL